MNGNKNPETEIFRCPHCANKVPMRHIQDIQGKKLKYTVKNEREIMAAMAHIGRTGAMPADTTEIELPEIFLIYQCPTCGDITIYKEIWDNSPIDKLNKIKTLIYPNKTILDENIIPKMVCDYYDEATKIKGASPNSFATTIRKAIEYICDDKGAKTSTSIYEKLEDLAKQNVLPQNIVDMGHIIRKVAQYGGHPKDEEITDTDADLLDDIFKLILDYVYITPYKVQLLEEKFKKVGKNERK